MTIKKYLERIDYVDTISTTFEALSTLQIRHLMTVPFENLDIHNNTKIDLTNLFNKIVDRKRGGFCYELNGLFYQLLKEIGFLVKMVSARVYEGQNAYSAEFDHMALIVTIADDSYLVDVGFGEFSFYPIKIELNKNTSDPGGIFRIEAFDETSTVVKKKQANGEFMPEYIFTGKARQLEDFYERCNYHQTNSESHFMKKRICSLPTKSGRITLTGQALKTTENGKVEWARLENEQETRQALWSNFGIEL